MAEKGEKKTKKATPSADRDELAQLIADNLNKMNKDDGKVAFFLDGQEETPTDLTDFISTEATMLDLAISNRPHGGVAVGRITEITGLEASGKSLVAQHIMASTIKNGGRAIYFDTENAVNDDFLNAIGVDRSQMVYRAGNVIEDIFESIEKIIETTRSNPKFKDKMITIVVDSIAGASTKKEMEADFDKDGYATDKAIIISKAMRKITGMIGKQKITLIFTNQLRQKMNAPAFSDPWTTSGGKAIAFHASTRIRLAPVGKIKDSNGTVVGIKTKASIVKNRLGPPHRTAEFDIYFDRGIDDYGSWLEIMKEHKLVKQAGAWYSLTDEKTGEEVKFQAKEFPSILESDKVRKEIIYNKICEAVIMKYRTEYDPDAMTLDTGTESTQELLLD